MAAWNATFIIAGLLIIAIVGEMYFRLTKPFINTSIPFHFVDGVGRIREPNTELRYANWRDDSFVVSITNSQGFLDREPINTELPATGCHITFIGDSYVEAREAPIADKFHVRLEEVAARELPHLDISTQAYGIFRTRQINQIPFYDEYARHLNPKLVALVFFVNDFIDNSVALQSLGHRMDPDRMPFMSAHRDANGALHLRPPDPEYWRFRLPRPPAAWHDRARNRLIRTSYFAKWLDIKTKAWVGGRVNAIRARIGAPVGHDPQLTAWMAMIAERPCCAWLLDVWRPGNPTAQSFSQEHLPPIYEDALEYTAFGIDQFKRRADRDGANLLIMTATKDMGTQGDPQFDRISAIAEARGIPIISDYDYILSQGHDAEDGRWHVDRHWNATGHQWAAEAILEWLKANQDVCD